MSCAMISNSKDMSIVPLRLMIVEDQTCLSHLYYVMLDKHIMPLTALVCHQTDAGKDAIEQIKSGYRPDFAILDIRINGINGIDVYRELRKVSNIPVVFLTAMNEKEAEFKEAVEAVGRENVLKKDSIKFFEDLLPKIPKIKEYLRCDIACLRNSKETCSLYAKLK